jgi:hypothetical protein
LSTYLAQFQFGIVGKDHGNCFNPGCSHSGIFISRPSLDSGVPWMHRVGWIVSKVYEKITMGLPN